MSKSIEIEPASITQFQKSMGGFIEIEDDVGSIAQQLQEIDKRLRLRANFDTGVFVVYAVDGEDEYLVSTYKELDGRVIQEAKRFASERYNYLAEMDRIDAEADRARKHEEDEVFGEMGEVLGHALKKDMGYTQDKIFLKDSKIGTDSSGTQGSNT